MNQLFKQILTALLLFTSCISFAQKGTITGKVTDADGEGLIGAAVQVQGAAIGTITDVDGNYSLQLNEGSYTLEISYIGYAVTTRNVTIGNGSTSTLNIALESGATDLTEVVVSTGSRSSQRTILDSPIPIDVFGQNELKSTTQNTFDKALQYRVPSFNTVNTPVNDATTLLDPYEIRNLGPSRTLILVNGKRKNTSSLLYVQFSPGRGETGADLSAIPVDAIKRVEILRDGASAQYGSDAIAGVMNVILKDRYDYSTLTFRAGTTTSGGEDFVRRPGNGRGDTYGVSLNSGSNFGQKGFINYTIDLSQQNSAVRSGIIDVDTEIATFGGSPAQDALIRSYLSDHPTGNNVNGSGEITAGKFLLNGGFSAGTLGNVYGNIAVVTKKVESFANFRTPYWRQDRGLLHSRTDNGGKNYITTETLAFAEDDPAIYAGYIGYVPTFEGDLTDYTATVGVDNEHNGWKHDVSLTIGGNKQLYSVNNTVNRTLGTSSPISFKPGGYSFNHVVSNLDVSKNITDAFGIAFGAEARSETYQIFAGDEASYFGEGSNSFPGIRDENARTNSRFNLGVYLDARFDVSPNFLINGTVRSEKYSDFGSASVWKVSSRYKMLDDKVILRGSVSTGFRAPSLHQIYAQSTQASFAGGTIVLSGLFNNLSAAARQLEIPRLTPEESTNISVGLGLNPAKNFNISLDYYNINIKDRIVYSSSITSSPNDTTSNLYQILKAGDLASVQFFINGVETQTDGIDFVANYRNLAVGAGKLGISLSGNYTIKNEIVGKPKDPKPIADADATILNNQVISLMEEGRPLYKAILGFDYNMGKLSVGLYNTLFGPTKFQDLDNGGSIMNHIKAEFEPAVVTDLVVSYDITKKATFTLGINNILNVLPKWDLVGIDQTGDDYLKDANAKKLLRGFLGFSGRYDILGYNGSQFSQLGTMINGNLSIRF